MSRDATTTGPSRRGRLPSSQRQQRQDQILQIAAQALDEIGYDALTMQEVADRASASKQTLYAWFGTREDLLAALIARNAEAVASRVASVLAHDAAPTAESARGVLERYAADQLTLLTGSASINLNRAAMASPRLAALLLQGERHTVGPLVGRYLTHLADAGLIRPGDAEEHFQLLYGLAIADHQIRVLLGEAPPTTVEVAAHATRAVERFWHLVGR